LISQSLDYIEEVMIYQADSIHKPRLMSTYAEIVASYPGPAGHMCSSGFQIYISAGLNKITMEKLTVTPIGYVRNGATPEIRSEEFRHLISDIVIEPEYADGLMDIEENEFLTVVFYFDRNGGEYRLRLHPRGDESRPITGVFNTRSQFRPSPVGITVTKLIGRKGNTLVVEGLDALDGTPVLDIKPHVLTFDEGKEIDDPGKNRIRKPR